MCNAWNHPPGCNCGWGRGTGVGGGNYNASSKKLEVSPNAKTRKIKCWWCGAEVYYHTNGYSDSVLFDELGYPWQIHECWQRYKQGQSSHFCTDINIDRDYQRYVVLTTYVKQFNFSFYEYELANMMNISIEQLRGGYGDLYYLDISNSLKLYSYKDIYHRKIKDELNQRKKQLEQMAKLKSDAKQRILAIRKTRTFDNQLQQDQETLKVKKPKKSKVTTKRKLECVYCKKEISGYMLAKHIEEQHFT